MIPAVLVTSILQLIGKAVDKAIPDRDQAERIKAELAAQAMAQESKELQGAIEIIKGEIGGESWLQRNWRPLLMLWFAGLVGAHWLGYTPPNLSQETIAALLGIVKVGIGGYVVGRSVEKTARIWREK